jgi:hypothetical protein
MVKETSTRHEPKFYKLLLETGTHEVQGFSTPLKNTLAALDDFHFERSAPGMTLAF